MFWNASIWGLCATSLNEITMMGCTIIKSAYVIPALISIVLGWLFIICTGLEPKKK
ncbi:MAG: hypothetical protein KJ566_00200 [Nanoarchaeota archaeon]|nr:hypothetical protein [Nanoarchaeota archaeon]